MRKLVLVMGLALVGFACADSVGQMLVDAGTSMQDGSVPDAGAQDEAVTCNKSETRDIDGGRRTWRWAEFNVDPGVTEVTVCRDLEGESDPPYLGRNDCFRRKATWFQGTSIGFVNCGGRITPDTGEPIDFGDPISITVHR